MLERKPLFPIQEMLEGVSPHPIGVLLPRHPSVTPHGQLVFVQKHFIENVHFRREWLTLKACGVFAARSVMSLSAPYGGNLDGAIVSIGLDHDHSKRIFSSVVSGIQSELASEGVRNIQILTTETSQGLMMCITLFGVPSSSYEKGVSGAKEGDAIYTTGYPGASAIAKSVMDIPKSSIPTDIRNLYLNPPVRNQCGRVLAREMLHSCIMVLNHGLLDGLRILAETSHVRIDIECKKIPIHAKLYTVPDYLDSSLQELVLTTGPCSELLFTVPPENEARLKELGTTNSLGVTVRKIGVCRSGHPEIVLSGDGCSEINV
jgi:thiamine monophosphate kinase